MRQKFKECLRFFPRTWKGSALSFASHPGITQGEVKSPLKSSKPAPVKVLVKSLNRRSEGVKSTVSPPFGRAEMTEWSSSMGWIFGFGVPTSWQGFYPTKELCTGWFHLRFDFFS